MAERAAAIELEDAAVFRRILGHLPTGVAVITAFDGERPVGMSCNSFTSVSLEPPLVLFCPARSSTTWPSIRRGGRFCANVLAHSHADAGRNFSRQGVDRFEGVAWRPAPHGPRIEDALAWVECEIEAEHEAGDHLIVVGRVEELGLGPEPGRGPLVFWRGDFISDLPIGGGG